MIISFLEHKNDVQNDKIIFINAQRRNISIEEIKKIKNIILHNKTDIIIILRNYNKSYLDVIKHVIKMLKGKKYIVVESENDIGNIQYMIENNSNMVISIKSEEEYDYFEKEICDDVLLSIDYNVLLNKMNKLENCTEKKIILRVKDMSKCSPDIILYINQNIKLYGIEIDWLNIKGSRIRHFYSIKEYIFFWKKIQSLAEIIDGSKSEYSKFKQAYYLIGKYIQYDFDDDGEPSRSKESHSLRGGILNRKAVCEGFSEILSQLLNMLNIGNKCVTGIDKHSTNKALHVWNQVKINGNWYNCDITNDSVNIHENRQVEMCLLNDEEFFLYEAISDNAEKCSKSWDDIELEI